MITTINPIQDPIKLKEELKLKEEELSKIKAKHKLELDLIIRDMQLLNSLIDYNEAKK